MNDPTLSLPGLSPVHGKQIVARFDSGLMSSDAGVLVLREIEQGLRIAEQMAGSLPAFEGQRRQPSGCFRLCV